MRLNITASAGRRWTAGFSLTELLVVMAIMAIIIGAAVPNFVRVSSRDRVEAAAYDLERTVTLARQKAVAKRRPYRVTMNTYDKSYYVERRDGLTWTRDPDEIVVVHPSVTMDVNLGANPSNSVLFLEPQGTIAEEDAPGYISFYNTRGDTAVVSVVRTGRIRTRVN